MKITLNPWRRARDLLRRNDELMIANQTLIHQLKKANQLAAHLLDDTRRYEAQVSQLRELINDQKTH